MNEFHKSTAGKIEWLGANRPRGIVFWCADGDGLVMVLSNANHNALFDQGEFVAWLPKNLDDALTHAAFWLANEYRDVYEDMRVA